MIFLCAVTPFIILAIVLAVRCHRLEESLKKAQACLACGNELPQESIQRLAEQAFALLPKIYKIEVKEPYFPVIIQADHDLYFDSPADEMYERLLEAESTLKRWVGHNHVAVSHWFKTPGED